jgi:hypothetical protein
MVRGTRSVYPGGFVGIRKSEVADLAEAWKSAAKKTKRLHLQRAVTP